MLDRRDAGLDRVQRRLAGRSSGGHRAV
jgi:hypothetical protein